MRRKSVSFPCNGGPDRNRTCNRRLGSLADGRCRPAFARRYLPTQGVVTNRDRLASLYISGPIPVHTYRKGQCR